MAFVGIEFVETAEIALVHKNWLTPKKGEVFWPPFKQRVKFDHSLKQGDDPNETSWMLYGIKRRFFETGK